MCRRSFFQDRIRQRTFEQFVDSPLQVAEKLVSNVFSQDRVQQRFVEQSVESPVEQNLDAPVPLMLEQLGEVPKVVAQNKIQIVDVPVRKVLEEHVGITKATAFREAECRPGSASRSVELCKLGRWRRCPTIRERRSRRTNFGRSSSNCALDRDACQAAWDCQKVGNDVLKRLCFIQQRPFFFV